MRRNKKGSREKEGNKISHREVSRGEQLPSRAPIWIAGVVSYSVVGGRSSGHGTDEAEWPIENLAKRRRSRDAAEGFRGFRSLRGAAPQITLCLIDSPRVCVGCVACMGAVRKCRALKLSDR